MATEVTRRPELRQVDKRSPQFHFALSVGPAFQFNSLQFMYDFFFVTFETGAEHGPRCEPLHFLAYKRYVYSRNRWC